MCRQPSPTGLYWSADGEVACAVHAPTPTDPRWTTEDWAPVIVLSGQIHGTIYQYQCQHCAVDGHAVEREAQLSEILERVQAQNNRAAYHERRADRHQQEADRLIANAKRRQAAAPPLSFVKRRKSA